MSVDHLRNILSLLVTICGAAGFVIGGLKGIFKIVNTLRDLKEMMEGQKETNRIMFKGILAALRGLEQVGANGPVTEAREEMEEYLIKEAS